MNRRGFLQGMLAFQAAWAIGKLVPFLPVNSELRRATEAHYEQQRKYFALLKERLSLSTFSERRPWPARTGNAFKMFTYELVRVVPPTSEGTVDGV